MSGLTGRAALSRREMALMAGLVLLLAAAAALAHPYLPQPRMGPTETLSAHSSSPEGARALYLWLEQLGYRPVALEHRPFGIDREVRLLLVLSPDDNLSEDHASRITAWVEAGGTLLLVADRSNPLLDRLGVEVHRRESALVDAIPLQPLFRDPPVRRVAVDTRAALRPSRPQWVPILGAPDAGDDPVAAVAALGRGRAIVLSSPLPLGNEGLGRADNAELVLHVLGAIPPGSTIAFDEYHHGLTEHGTLGALLLREPWGWALLYAAGLLFAYAAVAGRRFGRAVPLSATGARRTRVEYVATLAGLLRQAGHRQWLRQQFAAQVKRELGARYRVWADLPAAEFVAALATQRPEASALSSPLERLEGGQPESDSSIVALMRDVDGLRARLLGL